MLSVCIPYIHSEAVWNELLFTVRSIEKNLMVPHQVFLIGDKHPGLNIPVVPCEQLKGKQFSKVADSYKKMQAIIDCHDISEDFIYTYDDICFMKPIDLDFFNDSYCLNNMSCVKNGKSIYNTLKNETYFLLKKNGLPTWNCETHLPKMFGKKAMQEVMAKFITGESHLLLNSLFFNYHYLGDLIELRIEDKIKAGFYGCSSPYSFGNDINYQIACKDKLFVNYNNRGLTESLKKYIISNFKEKCSYEKL